MFVYKKCILKHTRYFISKLVYQFYTITGEFTVFQCSIFKFEC